ncbi:MAG: hypothetical protein PHS80_02855 [Methanothrix sp.]|nr:hypothetical protein [Methanothrix sp.]MDD4447693.1 hypothetical protein [Methanothrix sp.]
MISNSDKISRREEITEMFELGLKDATKDIDVVCRSEEDKELLLAAAKALGFEIVSPEKRHERMGVKRLAVKGGRNLDVFAQRISYDFDLSEAMWQRAKRIRSFGSLVVRDASLEDIFIMKLIANRPGDAPDCCNLVIAGLDYNAVYREIEAQYRKAGGAKEKIWINYIEEGIARLQDNDLTIPISDKISLLASEYHEKGQMR